MFVLLNEMAHLGDVRTKDTYQVYYFYEGITKHDHVHLRLNHKDMVEFWAVEDDTFKEKRFPKGKRLLKESEIKRLAELLTKTDFIDQIRDKALCTQRGSYYPIPSDAIDKENQKEINRTEDSKTIPIRDATSRIIMMFADSMDISEEEAMQRFYGSRVYPMMQKDKAISEDDLNNYLAILLNDCQSGRA